MAILTLDERERVGKAARLLLPSYGTCERCLIPWPLTQEHATPFRSYEQGGRGMFALCQACWRELTPAERLPFYRLIYERWLNYGTDVAWREIESAVLAGY